MPVKPRSNSSSNNKRPGGRGRGGGGRGRGRRMEMPSDEDNEKSISMEGEISAVLAGTMFRVKIKDTDHEVLAHISGKMRKRFIRLVVGDRVKLELSPYDADKARIVFRLQ
jgi:translation initiation factor IF-1